MVIADRAREQCRGADADGQCAGQLHDHAQRVAPQHGGAWHVADHYWLASSAGGTWRQFVLDRHDGTGFRGDSIVNIAGVPYNTQSIARPS